MKLNKEEIEKLGDYNVLSDMLSSMDPVCLDKDSNLKLMVDEKEIVFEKGKHFNVLK